MIYLDDAFQVRGLRPWALLDISDIFWKWLYQFYFHLKKIYIWFKVLTTFSFVKRIFTQTKDLGCKMVSHSLHFYSYFLRDWAFFLRYFLNNIAYFGKNTQRKYVKGLNDSDNHNGVVTHLEPDILVYEVNWTLGHYDEQS